MVHSDGKQTIANAEVKTCGDDCTCKQEKMGEGTYVAATDNSFTYTSPYTSTGSGTYTPPIYPPYTQPTTITSGSIFQIPIVPATQDYDERARKVLLSIAQDDSESTEDRIHAACSLLRLDF